MYLAFIVSFVTCASGLVQVKPLMHTTLLYTIYFVFDVSTHTLQ